MEIKMCDTNPEMNVSWKVEISKNAYGIYAYLRSYDIRRKRKLTNTLLKKY